MMKNKFMMKNKCFTAASILMLLIPWSILPLRTFPWALESPAAEIIIISYAAFMVFSGIFTILAYVKEKVQNSIMKICLIINSLYAAAGAVFLCLIFLQ